MVEALDSSIAAQSSNSEPLAQEDVTAITSIWKSLLTGPAWVKIGRHTLTTPARLWLQWFLTSASQSLERILKKKVLFKLCDLDESSELFSPAFAAVISGAGDSSSKVVAVDQGAGRALVDALTLTLAGQRGHGPLSDADCGVLEFLFLTLADRLLADLPGPPANVAFDRFWNGNDDTETPFHSHDQPLHIELSVGACRGRLALYGESWFSSAVTLPPRVEDSQTLAASAPSTRVDLRLALPSIDLLTAELGVMEPGDVILTGVSNLASFAADVAIVTRGGWRLGEAEWLGDSAGVVRVRCADFAPSVFDAWSAANEGNRITALPVMGKLCVSLDRLSRWRSGDVMDFVQDAVSPVELVVEGRSVARGEWVKVEDELGIRLFEVCKEGAWHGTDRTKTVL